MNGPAALDAKLREIADLRARIGGLRARWDELQTVEAAVAEYNGLLIEETRSVERAQARIEGLREALDRYARPDDDVDDGGEVIRRPDPTPAARVPARAAVLPPAAAQAVADRQQPSLEARARLQRLVGRFAFRWGLSRAAQGQINRIAEAVDRPLGEALILLDERAFAEPLDRRESAADHLARLDEWGGALAEYRARLEREVEARESGVCRSVAIWERWRAAQHSADGRRAWEAFIAESRRSARERVAEYEREADRLAAQVSDQGARGLTGRGRRP